jgi:AcrR family transcriptional regulator
MAVEPATRPRISREFVEGHRRRRYAEATAEILHEFGHEGLTVTAVVRLARTARNTFYETFGGTEDCVDHGIALGEADVFAGLEELTGEGDWLAELDQAIGGFFDRVAAHPLLAELFLVHAGGLRTPAARAAVLTSPDRFVPILRRGRDEAAALGRPAPSPLIDECLSRSIVSLAARRVQESSPERLLEESRSMTRLAAEFYIGRNDPSLGSASSSSAAASPR